MWTDAHHVTAWEHGGRTDLDQLVSLCRRHHGVAHRQGWTLTLEADGWTRWTTPSGITVTGQRHQRRPDHSDTGDGITAAPDLAVAPDLDDGNGTRLGSATRHARSRQHPRDHDPGTWADTG